MSLQTKEHQNLESQAPSAQQREAVKTPVADSPRHEEIRIRAYEIYIERGRQPSHDLDDWLQAERELEPKVRHTHAKARRHRSGAFMRSQVRLKSSAGPLHNKSSMEVNTGTSTRSVARVRNSSASCHAAKSDSARGRALRTIGSQ